MIPGDEPEPDSNPLRDDDLQLQEIDALTPGQVLNESGATKLPLPQQVREQMEDYQATRKRKRFSLLQLFAAVTLLCVMLGLTNWVPFSVYTLGLGLMTLVVWMGLFNRFLDRRHRRILIGFFLLAYCACAFWLWMRMEG